MKILMIFCDMLAAEYMNLCNKDVPQNKVDTIIKQYGGTVFTNCYTPSPDTPRSSACMWSGLYPRRNGCDNRLKYPRYFLKDEVNDLWKVLKKLGIKTNIYVDNSNNIGGLIKFAGDENIRSGSVYEFCEAVEKDNDMLNFIYLPDLHKILAETDYSKEGFVEGCSFIGELINNIVGIFSTPDFFDYIIIFSDHGFRFSDDVDKHDHIIDHDRIHTFMYLRKKNDSFIVYDDQLRSVLDIFPTMCEILSVEYKDLDGCSLLGKEGHEHILVEDHDKFSVEFGLAIEHWAVIDKKHTLHWLECSGQWEHEIDDIQFDENYYEMLVCKTMSEYSENRKLFDNIFIRYDPNDSRVTKETRYSDGTLFFDECFTFTQISKLAGKKIVLYGAGTVGKDYYRQFCRENCEVVSVVDINWYKFDYDDISVRPVTDLLNIEYDYVVVSIYEKTVAVNASMIIEQLGVPRGRILWNKPYKVRFKKPDSSM